MKSAAPNLAPEDKAFMEAVKNRVCAAFHTGPLFILKK
jgi:hypothetical protein